MRGWDLWLSVRHVPTSHIQPWGPELTHQPQPLSCLPHGCPHFPEWKGGGNALRDTCRASEGQHTAMAFRAWLRASQPSSSCQDSQGRRGVSWAGGGRILSFLPPSESPIAVRVTSQ